MPIWKYIVRVLTVPGYEPHPLWPNPIGKVLLDGERYSWGSSVPRFLKLVQIWNSRCRNDSLVVVTYEIKGADRFGVPGTLHEYAPMGEQYFCPNRNEGPWFKGEAINVLPEDIVDMCG